MTELKLILKGALVTLIFCLGLTLTILVVSELQAVRADVIVQPAGVTINNTPDYAQLMDTPPQRDITVQRFAPLEVE
jgi:hypothetical protein